MINQNKKDAPKFWRKWRASGAVSSGNEHLDKCLASATKLELEGKVIEAGIMRVVAHNDYSNWRPVPRPPLGKNIHSPRTYEGTQNCLYLLEQ